MVQKLANTYKSHVMSQTHGEVKIKTFVPIAAENFIVLEAVDSFDTLFWTMEQFCSKSNEENNKWL